MASTRPEARSPRKLRRALVLIALLAAGAIGWSVLWHVAARQTDGLILSWIERESGLGRQWSCPGRRIGGYPFDIEVICPGLQFQAEMFGRPLIGSLRGFRAVSAVFQPARVVARMEPPFTGKTPEGDVNIALKWEKLDLSVEGRPDARANLAIEGRDVSLAASAPGIDATARTVRASATPLPGNDAAVDFRMILDGVGIPSLAAAIGVAAPLDAEVGGVLTGADFSDAGLLADRIEKWRLAGGRIDLKTVHVAGGDIRFEAHGALDLDAARRPRGKLETAFEGLNPILARFGVDPHLLAAGSLLANLLTDAPGGPGAAGETRLPLRIADGWVSVGPIRTPLRLPPLY